MFVPLPDNNVKHHAEDDAEAHASSKKFATLLFTAETLPFALPHASIEAVLPLGQLMHPGNLPAIFAGFISYKTALIPCLRLNKFFKAPPAYAATTSVKTNQASTVLILKPEKNKVQSKLALLIDRVETSFWATESHFVAMTEKGMQHPSLSCGVAFGTKTYGHIHVPTLLQRIEQLCLSAS